MTAFLKMHGLGNDFAIFDARTFSIPLDMATAKAIADRRRGIGCDQVIVMEPAKGANAFMRIFNADGGDRFDKNRSWQNGPTEVGIRANAQGFDLNRDYVKAEAPETRASLAAFNRWDPDVFVDLHTTDGSFHGYALTYSPSLWPGADPYTRDSI